MRRVGLHNCPYCGREEIYASQPKTLGDEVARLFLFRVVRCHSRSLSLTINENVRHDEAVSFGSVFYALSARSLNS